MTGHPVGRDGDGDEEVRGMTVEAPAHATHQLEPRERQLLAAIRSGDEQAFAELVRRHTPTMIRLAQLSVGSRATAEEVVQEAWLGVLGGIDRFEGRSSLKTWIFRILMNKAHTRAAKESRTVVFSALDEELNGEPAGPAVDPDRFLGADSAWPGHWSSSPVRFDELPEERLLASETRDRIRAALDALPPAQRAVVTMRDLAGCDADEVCETLGLSASNQRVLLHRGRAKLRAALEAHLSQP